MKKVLKGLVLVLVLVAVGVAVAWGLVVSWVNDEGARLELEQRLRAASGLATTVRVLSMDWAGRVRIEGLAMRDPQGGQFLDVPVLEVDWRLPDGARPPLVAHLPGGQLRIRDAAWRRPPRPGQAPPAVPLGAARMRLARSDTLATGAPEPLLALELEGWSSTVQIQEWGADYQLSKIDGRARVRQDGRVTVESLAGRLQGGLPWKLSGRANPQGEGEGHLELGPAPLAEVGSVMPLSAFVVQFGMVLGGQGSLGLTWKQQGRNPPELGARLELSEASVRMGGEPLLEELSLRWDAAFEGPEEAQGPLELGALKARIYGLPIELREAEGRLRVGPEGLRVSHLRGQGPFGPVRAGYRLRGGPTGPDWVLTLDLPGEESGWLRGATLEVDPAALRLEGVRLTGPEVDLVVEARVLPEGFDPPTWRVEEGLCVGSAKSRPFRAEGLAGLLYLDSEGGYSFHLEGNGAAFNGQVGANRTLSLWLRPRPGAPVEELVLPAG